MPVPVLIQPLDQSLTLPAALEALQHEPMVLVFDSSGPNRAMDSRWTFLTADPLAVHRLQTVTPGCQPFQMLKRWQSALQQATASELQDVPPFHGGIAGLLSYELGHAFERLPVAAPDDFTTPALLAGFYDWAVVWDHLAGTVTAYLLDLKGLHDCIASDSRDPACGRIHGPDPVERRQWILERLSRPARMASGEPAGAVAANSAMTGGFRIEASSEVISNFSRSGYLNAVARVIEYIRAGDIFQANLSQQLTARWTGTAAQLFLCVREFNPAPFGGLFDAGDFAIVSASPERFLKTDGSGHVQTRPIKGTRRRPGSPIADLYAARELQDSAKDRAENVMIVDLLRNDLSRNCTPGSVRVSGLCEVERFETVLHLVSTVEAQLRPDRDVWDLLAGCFPGGSITGAPKIRAMQIISELEQTARGAYCGSLFYLGPRGDFDSSILIRTMTLKSGLARFPVGGGIVADSNPLDEYRETLHKASGLLRCLQISRQSATTR